MHPTRSLKSGLLPCLLFAIVWSVSWSPLSAAAPNFVIVLCDDLGYGDLGCYGHPTIRTPHLDQLAKDGIRFTDCYSAAPVCSPSRVGLLTGRIPNRAGVYDWIPAGSKARPDAREKVHLRASEVTLPGLLQKAGYATCLSGKYHGNSQFNQPTQAQPGDIGFDHWFATQNNASPSHRNPTNFIRNGSAVGEKSGYSCQIVTDEAIEWLTTLEQRNDEQPFFLLVAFHEPHEPIASPQSLVDSYRDTARTNEEAAYFANVTNLDLAVGRLRKALETLGEMNNTLFFFTSDNGPETLNRYRGAARSYGRATPLRGMKLWTTEAGFRVPGILYWPTKIAAGQVVSQPISSLDLLPTFCGLAGVSLPKSRVWDGSDILPMLRGNTVVRSQPLFWCFYNALNQWQIAMRTDQWKAIARLDGGRLPLQQNVHDGNVSMLNQARLTDVEIYRIDQDISEANNVALRHPAQAAILTQQMQMMYRSLSDTSHYWQREPSFRPTTE